MSKMVTTGERDEFAAKLLTSSDKQVRAAFAKECRAKRTPERRVFGRLVIAEGLRRGFDVRMEAAE